MDCCESFTEIRQLMAKMGNLLDRKEQSSLDVEDNMKLEINKLRAELDEKTVMIKDMSAEMSKMNEIITGQKEIIAKNELALSEKERIIKNQDELVKQKNCIIVQREDLVAQKEVVTARLTDDIAEQNVEIKKLNDIVKLQSDLLKHKNQTIEKLDLKIRSLNDRIHQLEEINDQVRKQLNSNNRQRMPGNCDTLYDQLKMSYYNSMSRCHLLEEKNRVLDQEIRTLGAVLVNYIIDDACISGLHDDCNPKTLPKTECDYKQLYPSDRIDVDIGRVTNDLIEMLDCDIKKAEENMDFIVKDPDEKQNKKSRPQSPNNKHPKNNKKKVKYVGLTSLAFY